ncbi:hypothetical protein D9758_013358 [Tetrapyrgos nigripes]|uniref:Uncharacterized protein n=1 Tax=Tetrapyrgos nigripes TaxID=182062 RepID=A0A8H5CJE9_9AGAR|nr:hypothetical protein D9758_013358 [Tetrapyrgos nigripes]
MTLKSTIRSNSTEFLVDIQFAKDHGLEYVFGKTNGYACYGTPGVSNVTGFCSDAGPTSPVNHLTSHCGNITFDTPYYAAIIAAEAIGNGGNTR